MKAGAAMVEEARAFFDQIIANFRQSVPTAFQQVEDQLAAVTASLSAV
jgi:outer membrane protein TolC